MEMEKTHAKLLENRTKIDSKSVHREVFTVLHVKCDNNSK